MAGQGRSTLALDDEGWVLDRLAGLRRVVSPELVRRVLEESNRVNGRSCVLSHEVMVWIVLGMGLFTHLPIRQVFRYARSLFSGEKCPARSSLCVGRQRLGAEPVRRLHAAVVRPQATLDTPGAFYHQWRLMAMDSTVLDVPDTEANASFGRSKGSRGESAFPQARKVSLVELGTHIETALAIGGWGDSERTLARSLWDDLPADALLLADRGFFCYEDWKALNSRAKLLFRIKNDLVLVPIRRLSDGSYLAKVYRNYYDRRKDRNGILVRVIEYTIDDPQRTGHGENHRLLTNLLDENEAPATELIELYHERWEQELVYDEQKTHQDPRRAEKPAQLRSETPDGVIQELYALSIGHFVVRAMMLDAARVGNIDVDRLSFVGCFRILQCRLPECASSTPGTLETWYQAVLRDMLSEQIPPRRNRINPRVIKRKMSKWPKKQPHHRRRPPLKKTFRQSIVMKT